MLKEKTKIFKALSDPNRLRIIKMLQTKKLCVCEITEVLQLATSTVSKHLSILRDNGFIVEEKDGKWINYYINPTPFDERVSSILGSLDFWISDDSVTNKDKTSLINIDRKIICCK
jgi:ArsR family transcriptional regulator, arsenate/arsenite/antimonite-responsive transcriptional repressor